MAQKHKVHVQLQARVCGQLQLLMPVCLHSFPVAFTQAVVQMAAGAPATAAVPEDDPLASVHKRARLTLPGDVAEADAAPLYDLMDFDVLPESERRAVLHHALQRDLRRLCAPAFSSREEAGPPPSMYC